MSGEPQKPKIIIDSDWKEQVRAEKEALQQQSKTEPPPPVASGEPEQQPGQVPPASFALLVSSLATQALAGMGQLHDPQSQEAPVVDLQYAQHHIDLLGVLAEKTKGNLSPDETAMLDNVLHELRMLFVHVGGGQ